MDTAITLSPLCNYDNGDGSKCNSDKIVARGYCDRHYRALKRSGAFADLDVHSKPKTDVLAANVRAVKRARKKLLKHAPDFVDHLVNGSRIASQNGKTDSAQWALLHTRVIEPVAVDKSAGVVNGTTINIGVKVSGTAQK